MFPQSKLFLQLGHCFLRASGGVSLSKVTRTDIGEFSPRKRRCFSLVYLAASEYGVFSAQAEVFLIYAFTKIGKTGFLRASGGVS